MLFHRHKFSEIKEDGYQYCLKCGISIVPPCNHKWKLVQNLEIKDGRWGLDLKKLPLFIRTYECENCGEMKNENVE